MIVSIIKYVYVMRTPISFKVYLVKGFIVSGYLFIGPFWIKIQNDYRPHYEEISIPTKLLKIVYFWINLLQKLQGEKK